MVHPTTIRTCDLWLRRARLRPAFATQRRRAGRRRAPPAAGSRKRVAVRGPRRIMQQPHRAQGAGGAPLLSPCSVRSISAISIATRWVGAAMNGASAPRARAYSVASIAAQIASALSRGPSAFAAREIARGGYAVVPLTSRRQTHTAGGYLSCNFFNYLAGAANRTRTCDPVITNDVLYQLSYCGEPWRGLGTGRKRPHLISGAPRFCKKNGAPWGANYSVFERSGSRFA